MFDPLNPSGGFGSDDETPPWPTTPFNKNGNSVANDLLRASSPVPRVPDKGPTQGLYGKEPQIYGQPEPGLISPRETTSSDGQNFEKPEPYLRVRVSGLDRNRRDILVKLDAQVHHHCCSSLYITLCANYNHSRPISPTSLAQLTGTSQDLTSSSRCSTKPSHRAIHRPSSPPSLIPKPPRRQTRRTIESSELCCNVGSHGCAKIPFYSETKTFARLLRATLATNLHRGRRRRQRLGSRSCVAVYPTRTRSFRGLDLS